MLGRIVLIIDGLAATEVIRTGRALIAGLRVPSEASAWTARTGNFAKIRYQDVEG